jgi:peptidoglycan/LPS O-acetylase OafA/YrhL
VIGFRHAWYPLPANVLYYAPCFCGGWWLFRAHRAGMDVTRRCEARLALSCAAFVLVLPLLRGHVVSGLHGVERAALVGLFVTFAWLSATGWLGACLKHLDHRPPRAVRYFAEASFWVYLFHHPVVELTQASLIGAGVSAAAKFGVVTLAGVTLPLLTYQVLVRRTWVGVLLNGRRLGVAETGAVTSVESSPRRKAA